MTQRLNKKPALTSTSTDEQWVATTITLDSELTLQGEISQL